MKVLSKKTDNNYALADQRHIYAFYLQKLEKKMPDKDTAKTGSPKPNEKTMNCLSVQNSFHKCSIEVSNSIVYVLVISTIQMHKVNKTSTQAWGVGLWFQPIVCQTSL